MKVTCPNSKQNPNCSKVSNEGRVCRSCSKYKGVQYKTCQECSSQFIYRSGYASKFCSKKCQTSFQKPLLLYNSRYLAQTVEAKAKRLKSYNEWTEERKRTYREKRSRELLSRGPEYLIKKSRSITDKILSGEFIPHGSHKKGRFMTKVRVEEVYHSLWELARMIELEEQDLQWTKKHGIKIPYYYKNLDRLYIPDFLIGNILEEVKPYVLLQSHGNKEKIEAAREWCICNNLIFNLKTDIPTEYLNKAKHYHNEQIKNRT